jgi:hypothetical protein
VHHNWFAKPSKESVVATGNMKVYRNVCGPQKLPED